MSERDVIALVGFILLFVLMALRVPVGIAMALVGMGGFAAVVGTDAALNLLVTVPIRNLANYELSIVPMFILMGIVATKGGMSKELFRAANAWLGGSRGGLATATIAACAAFAAICGSSVATAATMTKIALPEMRRAKYAETISTGVIAAGGTLGILIPPSVVMVVYAFITEQDVGQLFIAGIIPGIIAVFLQMATVRVVGWMNPEAVPLGTRHSWTEKFESLKSVWAVSLLFIGVIGGIYGGFVSPTEAAAFGAVLTVVISLLRRKMAFGDLIPAVVEALRTSVAIFIIIVGAVIFGYFLTVTQAPQAIADALLSLNLGAYPTLALILVFFLIMGCVLDTMAMVLLLVPIFFPVVVTHFGFDPIWFGIIVVVTVELGMITPPIGMNIFVIKSVAPNVDIKTVFRGVTPFIVSDILRLILLAAIPWLILVLPSNM
jgi:C4-dicarboxylate transporter, DctM subunit